MIPVQGVNILRPGPLQQRRPGPRPGVLRWLMHMLIYAGFMMLLLMHGLEKIVSESLFTDYYATVNPFF